MTISAISQRKDIENYKAKLSKTDVQKKRIDSVKEGFLVNNFVKDSINNNNVEIGDNFIIPQKTEIDNNFQNKQTPFQKMVSNITQNPLLPLCVTALSVVGGVALTSKILYATTKLNLKTPTINRLPDLPRNMNLNNENSFVTYMAIQNPNIKTILGAFATISFAGGVFVIKNFIDGFKDIWIKKQDAKIQRNLQEKLIEVETKSFAGKNNIIRNLMREKADEMKNISNVCLKSKYEIPPIFKGFLSFKGNDKIKSQNNTNNWLYTTVGLATVLGCIFLTRKTISNIKSIGDEISKYNGQMHKNVSNLLNNSSHNDLLKNKNNLLQMFSVLNFKTEYVREQLKKANLSQIEIDDFIAGLEKRYRVFVEAPEALGGKQGIQYYSYIDDVQGHLYNWIMNYKNGPTGQFTKNLFLALCAVTGLAYVGKTTVEAVKDVQVKKVNAQTDLDLHKQLVNVELRNFEAKKRSNIDVLMQEFKRVAKNNQQKEKLESMATEILYEIKNGAPFVYS